MRSLDFNTKGGVDAASFEVAEGIRALVVVAEPLRGLWGEGGEECI